MKQKVPFLPSSDEAAKHNKAKGPGRHFKFGQSLSFSSQRRDRGYDDGRALSSSHPLIVTPPRRKSWGRMSTIFAEGD